MNNIQVFNNPAFGSVRMVVKNNEPWFVGKDIAEILGYVNQNRDIVHHIDEEDRFMVDGKTQYQNGIELGQRGGWIINESGLYSLILSSKLPQAKAFKRWVTSEVLPAIRKNGSYGMALKEKEVEAKLNNSRARLNNSRARMAALILKCAEKTKSDEYKEICNKNAVDVLNGKEIMPMLPAKELTLSAKEVGEQCGISENMVGRLANKYNLKTDEYGKWYHTTAKHNDKKEIDTFRYYPAAVDKFKTIIKENKGGAA